MFQRKAVVHLFHSVFFLHRLIASANNLHDSFDAYEYFMNSDLEHDEYD